MLMRSPPPFMILHEKLRAKNAHREVLKSNVGLDEAQRLLKSRQFPEGSSYVAVLGTIYGPEPINQKGSH